MESILSFINKQDCPDFEIIVVDDDSTAKTKEISKSLVAEVYNQGPERSAQRNFGFSKAKGDYVCILNADMILENGILEEMYLFAVKNSDTKCVKMKEEFIGNSIWAKAKKLELEFYTQP
jgi:glycosyltransferase involved in cell wall biosynthesis